MARRKGDNLHGWLVLDKDEGISSTSALGAVRRLFNARKAGHAGTLDPLASGVLPIAFGEATKTISWLMDAEKEYEFSICWGVSTDSQDREGKICARSEHIPKTAAIKAALSSFVGEIEQTPPIYSAIKVDGKRSYELARQGENPKLAPRPVKLFSARLLDDSVPEETKFHIRCGKGFYVRALARDLALQLDTCGHISVLRRLRVGPFACDDAKSLDILCASCHKIKTGGNILPVTAALGDMPICELGPVEAGRIRHGNSVQLGKQIYAGSRNGQYCLVTEKGTVLAVASFADCILRPVRVFNW